jgi:8-oxo-dGTP pyrophosphatase MutT (NUDIX family)
MLQDSDEELRAAPAATVVVLRNTGVGCELLLVQRASELAFHGGAWVFPGGRVEEPDRLEAGDDLAHARRAAVREVAEETGLAVRADALVPLAHWTTPKGRARCFATWFFLAISPAGDVLVDGLEIKNHRWLTAAVALELRAAGELVLPAPTFVTLTWLLAHADAEGALGAARAQTPEAFVPRPRNVTGGVCSLYAGDAAYAGGELDLPGARHRLWMLDRGWSYERTTE